MSFVDEGSSIPTGTVVQLAKQTTDLIQDFTAATTDIFDAIIGNGGDYSEIRVRITGMIQMGDDTETNTQVSVLIDIDGSSKSASYQWPNFSAGAFSSGELRIPFALEYSASCANGGHVKVQENSGADDPDQEVRITSIYIEGIK